MTIQRSAYLSVCAECRRHARIILPDGSKSRDFVTQPQGEREIERLLAKNQIAKDEAEVLKSLLADSKLSAFDHPVLGLMQEALELHEGGKFTNGETFSVDMGEVSGEKRTLN